MAYQLRSVHACKMFDDYYTCNVIISIYTVCILLILIKLCQNDKSRYLEILLNVILHKIELLS